MAEFAKKTPFQIAVAVVVLMSLVLLLTIGNGNGETHVDDPRNDRASDTTAVIPSVPDTDPAPSKEPETTQEVTDIPAEVLDELEQLVNNVSWGSISGVFEDQKGGIPDATIQVQGHANLDGQNVDDLDVTRLLGKAFRTTVLSDRRGEFFFPRIPPGTYRVSALAEGLPQGVIPPWNPHQTAPWQNSEGFPDGFFATLVTIPADGGDFEVELRGFTEAVVSGTILHRSGSPVRNAYVRAQCSKPGLENLAASSYSDHGGQFAIHGVYPGSYRLEVELAECSWQEHRDATPPTPVDFVTEEGGGAELGTIYIGGDGAAVTGRVIDDQEQAFVGIEVLAYLGREVENGTKPHNWTSALGRVTTEADGSFAFWDLPAELVKIQVAPEGFLPNRPFEDNLLQTWVAPVVADLRKTNSVDVGKLTAIPNRAFVFYGTIALDTSYVEKTKAKAKWLQAKVYHFGGHPNGKVLATIKVDKDGTFSWVCEDRESGPYEVVIETKRKSLEGTAEPVIVAIRPEGRMVDKMTIKFPGQR